MISPVLYINIFCNFCFVVIYIKLDEFENKFTLANTRIIALCTAVVLRSLWKVISIFLTTYWFELSQVFIQIFFRRFLTISSARGKTDNFYDISKVKRHTQLLSFDNNHFDQQQQHPLPRSYHLLALITAHMVCR